MPDPKRIKYSNIITDILNFPSDMKMQFPRVGMRFLPLLADPVKLQAALDKWLNLTHDTDDKIPFYFKVLGPFVVLQINNFDRLEFADQWLTQHEAIFSIPLEWYDRDDKGNLTFHDWGMASPFLYLDNPISVWIGREIFGWPKVSVSLPYVMPSTDPEAPQLLLSLKLPVYAANNPNRPCSFHPFLEIYQDPVHKSWLPSSAGEFFTALPRAVTGTINTIAGMWQTWANLVMPTGRTRDADTVQAMLQRGFGYGSDWSWPQMLGNRGLRVGDSTTAKLSGTPFMNNQFGLKEFRDAQITSSACYQAIIKSSVNFDRANDVGLLFDPMSGDPSGGISIRIYEWNSQPLVRELGIRLAGSYRVDGTNQNVAIIKPVFPFWWNVDLDYSKAADLCWRTRNSTWETPAKKAVFKPQPNKYVSVGGGGGLEIPGPFKYPEVTIRVFPIDTESGKLSELCKQLFPDDLPYTVTPVGTNIFMLVSQFDRISLADSSVPQWSDSEVSFGFGATVSDTLTGHSFSAFLPLINFVLADWHAITDREEYGRISLRSTMTAPAALNQSLVYNLLPSIPPYGPSTPELSFLLKTHLCPTVADEHQGSQQYSLLGIINEASPAAQLPSTSAWYKQLGFQNDSDNTSSIVNFKQIRDAEDPGTYACYQALVRSKLTYDFLDGQSVFSAFGGPLTIYFREYKNIQLVTKLGLNATAIDPKDDPLPDEPSQSLDIIGRYRIKVGAFLGYRGPITDLGARILCWRTEKDWSND